MIAIAGLDQKYLTDQTAIEQVVAEHDLERKGKRAVGRDHNLDSSFNKIEY